MITDGSTFAATNTDLLDRWRWRLLAGRAVGSSVAPSAAGLTTSTAESVADKPMFRDAFVRHRCIIPASGYYEWLKRPDGRQPYFISAADGRTQQTILQGSPSFKERETAALRTAVSLLAQMSHPNRRSLLLHKPVDEVL
jgi:hypothetical protein